MCFFYIANNIDNWLLDAETNKADINKLVYTFFITLLLVATQDITVDGWALSILKKFVICSVLYKNIITVHF